MTLNLVDTPITGSATAVQLIRDELSAVADQLSADASQIDAVAALLASARRVFVIGLGRSGLAMRMTGMRLMHLGLDVHIVGEVTTPAITAGDVLLAASGSGTTGGIVRAAENAHDIGAKIAAITTAPGSPLGQLAAVVVPVPAAGKLDRSAQASAQYAGSLFEQGVVLVGDALFHALWTRSGQTADDLWPRHANLE